MVEYPPGASFTRGTQADLSELHQTETADHIGRCRRGARQGRRSGLIPSPTRPAGAPLLTNGGGSVFGGGTNDKMFRAFDAKTGEVLYEMQLNSG